MNDNTQFQKKLNRKHNETFLFELGKAQEEKLLEELEVAKKQFEGQEVPTSFINNFEKTMSTINSMEKKSAKELEKKRQYSRLRKNLSRVAVLLIVLIVIGGGMTLGVEAFRVRFFNLFISDQKTHTDLIVSETNELERPTDLKNYSFPTYIVHGYKLDSYSKNDIMESYIFSNEMDLITIFIRSNSDDSAYAHLDSEGVEVYEVEIDGHIAYYTIKEDVTSIAWNENKQFVRIIGEISKEEIIKIAESLTFFEN